MRVLQIINSLQSGGAEKLVVDTCIKYSNKGVLVDVLLLNGCDTPFLNTLKKHKEINIITLDVNKNIYNPLYILKIKPYLKAYDVIHVHLFPALYWVALANLISTNKNRIIVTEHNTTNRRRKLFFFKMFDKIVYKQFKNVITISDAVDENLRLHLGEKHVSYKKIYNGINLELIDKAIPYEKEALNFKATDKIIIQVASFTPQKDQKTLIKAVKLLPDNCKLILVGKGPLEDECNALVKDLGLTDRVQFYGIRSDVPCLLKSVDIVVLSSYYEGLSLSSIEGMASGKPFVASDAPGLKEVVKGAGVLFEIENEKQLSTIILKLIENKDYAQTVAKSCVAKSKVFDINIMVDQYMDLYKKLTSNSK